MMNKMILWFCLAMPLCATAQIKLKGNVQDGNSPVAWANVILLDLSGKMVKGMMTNAEGNFEIETIPGTYNLKVSALGFTSWEEHISAGKDTALGTIQLQQSTGDLDKVVVVAKKRLIEYKPDRLVFNVESSISGTGGDAVSAIGAAPGVIVQNGGISMLGKGSARVMVDGRMIELSGEELFVFLRSIPSDDIKSIEVITNPPAKYEAGGDGGLINIVLKKGATNSWKNTTSLSGDQNTYSAVALRNNFLYNKDKVRFSLSMGGKTGYSRIKQDLDTYYPGGPWELRYTGKQKEDNFSGRVAFDYNVSANTTIGVQYLGNYSNPGSRDKTNIDIRNVNHDLDSLLINNGHRNTDVSNHTYNAHLISRLDTLGRKFSVDADYFKYDSRISNNFVATSFSPAMEFLHTNQAARNISDQRLKNYSISMDMEHPLKFMHLAYGAKFSFVDSKAGIQYYNTITATPVPDPARSDEFSYKENNTAVYINGARDINSRLSIQLGLRVENTQTRGYSKALNRTNTNDYLKLFPTFYISYRQNERHNFLLNYGKRINRPGFGLLNPFRSYINSNSYSEGNPFLQPSFSNNFDFTHIYKGKLRTNVFFNITSGGFGPVFTSDAATNTLIISRQNYFTEYFYGAGENYSADITAWWQSQYSLYLLGSVSRFANHIQATPKNGMQLYLSANNTFSLGGSTKLQVDYSYSTAVKRGLYTIGYNAELNIGLKKNLFKDKLQASLLCNDIFNTAWLKDYTSVVNGIRQVYGENNSSRFFRFSLAYTFGNKKVNVSQRDFGNSDETKRAR